MLRDGKSIALRLVALNDPAQRSVTNGSAMKLTTQQAAATTAAAPLPIRRAPVPDRTMGR
jgi:hypothetical protein